MNNEQAQEKSRQEQQQEDHELLRSERKARGELREAHLEGGREQARRDNAETEQRNAATPPTEDNESKGDRGVDL